MTPLLSVYELQNVLSLLFQKNKFAFDLMKITFQLETILEQTPNHAIHNMSDAQTTAYITLTKQKSAMSEELHLLMIIQMNSLLLDDR